MRYSEETRGFLSVNGTAGYYGETTLDLTVYTVAADGAVLPMAEAAFDCTHTEMYVIRQGKTFTTLIFAKAGMIVPESDSSITN